MFDKLQKLALAMAFLLPSMAHADGELPQISLADKTRWAYFSDQVMGGVSEGRAAFEQSGGQTVLRLTGKVSTANNGGFIQARTKLEGPLPANATGVVLSVRGNDQPYFVHLRTTRTLLPWQFYQATFNATATWSEVRIPFTAFTPYGSFLGKTFNTTSVRSIAIVAFGRDHTADLSVRAVGFY
jgi:hypothetical protein